MKLLIKIIFWSFLTILWSPFLYSTAHAASPELCQQEQVVGIEKGSVLPFISNKGPEHINMKEGFIVDLLGEITAVLCPGKNPHAFFKVRQADFDELFKRIDIECYDLIAGPLPINAPTRGRDHVAYSYPFYREAGIVIALKEKNGVIENEEALIGKIRNKTVVVQKETPGHQSAILLNEAGLNLKIVPVENENELFTMHDSFAMIHDYPILQFHINANPKIKETWAIAKIKENTPYFLQRAQYGFVAAKHNFALLSALNDALTQLENKGVLARLEKCWVDNRPQECDRKYEVYAEDVKGTVETISQSEVKTGSLDILGNKGKTKFVNVDIEGELISGKCQLWFSEKNFRLFERLELPRPFCGLRALFVETSTPLMDYFWFFPGVSGGYTYRDSSRSVNRLNLSIGIIRGSLVTEPLIFRRAITLSITYNPIGGLYDLNLQKGEFSRRWEVEGAAPVNETVNAALTYTATSPWKNRPDNHISQTIGLGLKFK